MSATRAKKVKMATKSCPECDQQKTSTRPRGGEQRELGERR
uniref:RIKEN cDNA 4921524J17 gene n=1 Tax=Mus musculus TaxID=10090 RepID=A0A1B0GRH9_MOUSE